ncbi:MAG: phage tail protein [Candidatus Accumulibacter phosphatis]
MSTVGQLAGGLVGGIAGAFLGGPTGALYGAQIGLGIGGYLDPAPGPTTEGPRLSDRSVQTSTYGAVIPRIYGTAPVAGNLIWLQGNALTETVTKTKKGGKGGGSKTTTVTYSYSATCAFALADTRALGAPFIGIRRIWTSQGLYYDAGSSDPDTIQASNAAADGFTFYHGSDTQLPDPSIQADIGAANTPAYRGLAYIVFNALPLAAYGNSLAGLQLKVELVQAGTTGGPADVAFFSLPSTNYHSGPLWDGSEWYGIIRTATDTGALVTSPDMLAWSQYSLPASYGWGSALYHEGVYIACAPTTPGYSISRISTSSDKVSWTTRWNGSFGRWYTKWIVPGNGGVLFIEEQQGTDGNSADGTRSVLLDASFAFVNYGWIVPNFNCANSQPCHNGTVFIVGGNVGAVPRLFISTTGTGTWSEQTVPAGVSHIYGICAFGSSLLMAAFDQGTNTGKVAISTNSGVSWGAWVELPAPLGVQGWRNPSWNGVEFFIVEDGTSQWATSPDGVTWEAHVTSVGLPTYKPDSFRKGWNGSAWGSFSRNLGGCFLFTQATSGISPADVPLSTIVAAECLQSGLLTSADIDVAALTSDVRGYRIGSLGTIRAALEPLRAAWPFDVVQDGYGLRFAPRGGASVVTIPAADLDARPAGESPGVQITTAREMDSQLPRRIEINFLDVEREYDAGLQYDERLNTAATNLETIDLPIVLNATEAAGKAQVLLYQRWLDRYTVGPIRLPSAYAGLQPADVVSLTTAAGLVDLRLTSINYTADNRLEITGKYNSPAIYTPTAVGAAGQATGVATLTPIGASIYQLLDIPLVTDVQAVSGFIAAMYGAKAGWQGGVLMQSTDAGANWAAIDDFGPPGATIGAATNTIGAVESRLIDKASRLTVVLANGDLSSTTELAMLGGANHFAYGAHGRWEIIAAQTCALQSGSTYILSNLLRGRFGTEQHMGAHVAGDSVVLLDADDASFIPISTGSIGLARHYRGITLNRDISTDSNQSFTYSAVNLKPLAPIALTGNRHPSTNDWALTWLRRTRSGGEWRDYVDADLGETSEQYHVDIHSDGSYTAVKRTLTVTAQGADYTSADQVTDFGSNQATLYVKIYQLSPTVGRGTPLTASITR